MLMYVHPRYGGIPEMLSMWTPGLTKACETGKSTDAQILLGLRLRQHPVGGSRELRGRAQDRYYYPTLLATAGFYGRTSF